MAFIFATSLLVREKLWVIGGLDRSNHLYHFAGDYLLLPISKQPMGKNTDIREISMYETSVSPSILIFSLASATIGLDFLVVQLFSSGIKFVTLETLVVELELFPDVG